MTAAADRRLFNIPPCSRYRDRPARAARAALMLLVAMVTATATAAPATAPAAPATATATQPARPIRVHGNDDRFWIVQVYGVPSDKGGLKDESRVYRRAAGDEKWQLIDLVDSDVMALGSRQTQLAILKPDGSWRLVSDETASTGPALPGAAKIVTFGHDGATLWAIGERPAPGTSATRAATPPTTSPATVPSGVATAPSTQSAVAAATRPATAPAEASATQPAAPSTFSLYSLEPHGWVRGADLPPAAQGGAGLLSLSFVDHEPVVAWRAGPRSVEVNRLTDLIWQPAGEVQTSADVVRLKLIAGTPRPVLWVAAGERESKLLWLGRGGEATIVALPLDAQSRAEDVAVAFANGRVRVVGYVDGKLTERTYDPLTGAATGEPAPLLLPKMPASPTLTRWVEPLIVVALIYVIVASVRRRDQMRDVALNPTEFVLAPVGRRLLAGIVDALPVLIAGGFTGWQYARSGGAVIGNPWLVVLENMAPSQMAIFGGGCLLYLIHTSLGEVLFGRSIGKACCGLRVVGLDGRPAAPGAVVVRNLLRVIDLAMVFFPLVLILFSPLRQRAGDVAAGTLVVMNGKTQPVESPEASEQESINASPAPGPHKAGSGPQRP